MRTRYLNRYSLTLLSLALVLVLTVITTSVSLAASRSVRVVVLVANHLELSDLQSGPNLRLLTAQSGVGLANTGFGRSISSKYMALGSGGRLSDPDGSPIFRDSSELTGGQSAAQVYNYQMGKQSSGSVLCVGFPRLARANSNHNPKNEKLGLIGDVFHKNGLSTAVIGNSDLSEEEVRGAPLIAMDDKGMIDAGSVGKSVVKADPDNPAGCRDDLDAISVMMRRLMADNALIVLELGDFNRMESLRYRMSDAAYKDYRNQNLRRLDSFIGNIRKDIDRTGATLVLCSPARSKSEGYFSNLAPLLVYKPGGEPGVLLSGTARCRGLVSNIDVGPTIIRYADLNIPKSVLGQPAHVIGMRGNYEWLSRMEQIASRNYALQLPILVLIAAIVMVIITLSELSLRWKKANPRVRKVLGVCLLGVVSLPAAFLLVDGMSGVGMGGYVLRLAIAAAALTIVSVILGRVVTLLGLRGEYAPLAIVQIITAVLLAWDALIGTPLLRWSILSCDHITGIRFYGIGNEYMGIFIGEALFGPLLLLRMKYHGDSNKPRVHIPRAVVAVLLLWFAFVSLVVGYPGLGANVGGLITAIVTFGVALTAMTGTKFQKRHVLSIAALVVLITAGFAVIDFLSPGESHLGRTLGMVSVYGWGYLWNLIVGKIGMHIGILKMRQAYIPMIASIPFLMLYRNRVKSEKTLDTGSDIMYRIGTPSVIAGVVVAFLFNDSGIVPAALIFALFMISALHLRLQGAQS